MAAPAPAAGADDAAALPCSYYNRTQTCLVLPPHEKPWYAESVAYVHFIMGGISVAIAFGFIFNAQMAQRVMVHLGTKNPTDRVSFFIAPFLCCVFAFDSLVHALSVMPVESSPTYVDGERIGCECIAPVDLQNARYGSLVSSHARLSVLLLLLLLLLCRAALQRPPPPPPRCTHKTAAARLPSEQRLLPAPALWTKTSTRMRTHTQHAFPAPVQINIA